MSRRYNPLLSILFIISLFLVRCDKARWNLAKAPTITTVEIADVGIDTAISGGKISSDGGAQITARGVCWSTAHNPIISSGARTNDGTGSGSYQSIISGLVTNTVYYVRAYATNIAGTSYGNEVEINISPRMPIISTTTPSNVYTNSAQTGGNITDNGGVQITARGVCWSTMDSPTIALPTKTSNSAGIGIFISNITGLLPGTKYYTRAYATNMVGTAYGSEVTFTTPTTLVIGQPYAGGIIFYLDSSGMHGISCSDSNVSYSSSLWGCATILVGTSASVGSGAQNTANIIAQTCEGTYAAARLCTTATINGYSDWYLPSIDELALMYNNLSLIGLGNFQNGTYWSSTEYSSSSAYCLYFSSGTQFPYDKIGYCGIRPVRSF